MVCGRLSVRLLKVKGHGDIMERKLEVKEHKSISTNILTVKMMQLTSWPLEGFPHPSAIISLINKLTKTLMSASSKQTVIMCRYIHDLRPVTLDMNVCPQLSDVVVRSGTFLVIHSQLERLKTEGAVDVFQAIKSARIQRPGVIPNTVRMSATQLSVTVLFYFSSATKDHYIFCYELLADYVERMEAYHNFKTLM